jgi:hypothetical protein
LAGSSLVLGPNEAVCDVELVHIVVWVVAEREMRRLRAPLWYAATDVTGDRDRVQHVTVLENIEDYAHVGKLAWDSFEGMRITLIVTERRELAKVMPKGLLCRFDILVATHIHCSSSCRRYSRNIQVATGEEVFDGIQTWQ